MDSATLLAVGDTAPYVDPPESIFDGARDLLESADWRFAQVERVFSRRGEMQAGSQGDGTRVDPDLAVAYQRAGFDVLSLATNHAGDYGTSALLDSIDALTGTGAQVVGAGPDIVAARRPAVLAKGDLAVGVLAYCSLLLPDYWATEERPGCAPLRAQTYYRQVDYSPGSPPAIHTEPVQADLDALREDVRQLRSQVDAVVLSVHWGVHFLPRNVQRYQRVIARAAVDAGCDVIVGHGPHLVHGVEVIDGAVCLYSLGNFVMSSRAGRRHLVAPAGEMTFPDLYDIDLGPGRHYGYLDHSKLGLAALIDFEKGAARPQVALVPTTVDSHPRAVPIGPGTQAFEAAHEFVQWSSEQFGSSGAKVEADGERLRVG